MGDRKEQWWASIEARFGSREAAREYLRVQGAKTKGNPSGVGGFRDQRNKAPDLFLEKQRERGIKGAQKRWHPKES